MQQNDNRCEYCGKGYMNCLGDIQEVSWHDDMSRGLTGGEFHPRCFANLQAEQDRRAARLARWAAASNKLRGN